VADGLPSPFVQGISGISATTFWAATYGGGIVQQVNGMRTYHSTATALPTDYFRCVFRSTDGAAWFGSVNHGVLRFYNGAWAQYTVDDGLAGNTVLAITQDAQNAVWLAGPGGLSRLLDGQWEAIQTADGAHSSVYHCLEKMPNGQLWAGGDNGIDVFADGEHVEHITVADGLNGNSVTALLSDAQSRIWTGYAENGASFRQNGIWHDKGWGTGLSSKWVSAMAVDEQGHVHFGTQKMTYFDGHNWLNYGVTNGYNLGSANQMWRTDDGRLWAANANSYAVNVGDEWQWYAKPFVANGSAMLTESNGTKWYCHVNGVYRESALSELTLFEKDAHLRGMVPENIMADSSDRIWVISTAGLCLWNGDGWECHEAPSSPKETYVLQPRSLAVSPDGNPMFVARKSKMGQFLPNHFVVELRPLMNKRKFVDRYEIADWASYPYHNDFRLTSDTYRGIWLACRQPFTASAPVCIQFRESGEIIRHDWTNGLPSKQITSMMDDGQGYMWVCSNDEGVSRAPLLALGAADGQIKSPKATMAHVYPNPSGGLFTLEYTPSVAHTELTVHDLMGRRLLALPLTLIPRNVNAVQIDLGMLPSGTYLLRTAEQDHLPTRIVITNNQ
jgi:ligand-binding sensor domain-containing protein